MDMVAVRAINVRLALTQAAGPPGKYGIFIENGEQGGHRLIMLWDNFVPGQWRPAVAGLARTSCDLSTSGLSEQEWTAAKHYALHDLERRATDMANLEWARQLSNARTAGRHLIPPDEMLRHARTWLPAIGAQAMNGWWRRQWSAGAEHVRVESPELAQVQDPRAASARPSTGPSGAQGAGSAIPGFSGKNALFEGRGPGPNVRDGSKASAPSIVDRAHLDDLDRVGLPPKSEKSPEPSPIRARARGAEKARRPAAGSASSSPTMSTMRVAPSRRKLTRLPNAASSRGRRRELGGGETGAPVGGCAGVREAVLVRSAATRPRARRRGPRPAQGRRR